MEKKTVVSPFNARKDVDIFNEPLNKKSCLVILVRSYGNIFTNIIIVRENI